jgi:hypothetical protein
MLIVYAGNLNFGPSPLTPTGLEFQVLSQKAIAFAVVAIVPMLSAETPRAAGSP